MKCSSGEGDRQDSLLFSYFWQIKKREEIENSRVWKVNQRNDCLLLHHWQHDIGAIKVMMPLMVPLRCTSRLPCAVSLNKSPDGRPLRWKCTSEECTEDVQKRNSPLKR